MSFPQLKRKHKEKALFTPYDYIRYKKFPKNLPKKYIITYQQEAQKYFKQNYKCREVKLYSLLTLYLHKDLGFVKIEGIGSPQAATVLEELIALGGKVFLNIGTAGGLQKEGVFLCTKALRDEGTSHHYIPSGRFAYPDQVLTRKLSSVLENKSISFTKASTWTIDAPYRETKAELVKYKRLGIATVEMEAAALFAVARYRKVKIAAAFVISDIVGAKWRPRFHRLDTKAALHQLVEAAVNCLQHR